MKTALPAVAAPPSDRWHLPHYLALLGVPILVVETWTIGAWLADGPHRVTEFGTRNGNWYAAKSYEGLGIALAVVGIAFLMRGCRRERRVLTFDVLFCACGATMIWTVFGANFLAPTFLATSNFISVNDMCGHMPFVVNPDCGRAPNAILFWLSFSAFGPLVGARLMAVVVGAVRRRRPGISTTTLVIGLAGLAGVLALCFEGPAIALGLWTYVPGPGAFPLGPGLYYTLPAMTETALFFLILGSLHTFRDDRGRTLLERKLGDVHGARHRALLALALYATFQLVAWIPGSVPVMLNAFYARPLSRLPTYVVNDMCDAPGISNTRYGLCPGTRGYRLPGRHSLPGRSP